MLDKGKGREVVFKEEGSSAKDGVMLEDDESKQAVTPGITRLPGIFVRELVGQHSCQCQTCSPNLRQELETKLVRRLHRERAVELSESAK